MENQQVRNGNWLAAVGGREQMKMKLAKQLTIALQNLNAPIELLCIVGSYGDTQSDEDILECLEQYNERGTCMSEIIAPAYKWEPKL